MNDRRTVAWAAASVICWLVLAGWTLLRVSVPSGFGLVFLWASVVAGGVAISEAYVTQLSRRQTGQSRWSPSTVVALGLLLSFVSSDPHGDDGSWPCGACTRRAARLEATFMKVG